MLEKYSGVDFAEAVWFKAGAQVGGIRWAVAQHARLPQAWALGGAQHARLAGLAGQADSMGACNVVMCKQALLP